MKINFYILINLLAMLLLVEDSNAQDLSGLDSIQKIPAKYFNEISQKADGLRNKIDRKTEKALRNFKKQQHKLQKVVTGIDSANVGDVFTLAEQRMAAFENKLMSGDVAKEYVPSLDTLMTSINFLNNNKQLLSKNEHLQGAINVSKEKLEGLGTSFNKANQVKEFLREQKKLLNDRLDNLGAIKELKKINKQVYYYNQQINQYKEILKDKKKIESKTIELLTKTKIFKDFMRKNSMLASMFPTPGGNINDPSYLQALGGLQTRNSVTQLMQQRGSGSPANTQQQMQSAVQQGMSQMQTMRDKLDALGGKEDLEDLKDFKPNDEKTRTFLQRLDLGMNIQSQRANNIFPRSTDIGLSLGYKINDKSIIGIGASYQMSWGKNIRNISITHKGVGLRSFIDWKIKGGFWVSGGYEMNYRSAFTRISQLQEVDVWQHSGLLGVTKKFTFNNKFIKGTKVQLLWDLMSYRQVPRTQPILFRFGYGLK